MMRLYYIATLLHILASIDAYSYRNYNLRPQVTSAFQLNAVAESAFASLLAGGVAGSIG